MRKTMGLLAAASLVGATAAGASGAQTGRTSADSTGCAGMSATACEYAAAQVVQHNRAPGGRQSVLRFQDVEGESTSLDLGVAGNTPGDTLFFDNGLRNWSSSHRVGRFTSRCTQVTDSAYHCQGTLLLGHGTIELATTTDFTEANGIVAAVVGGTGRHLAAAGQARISPSGTPGISSLVVRLIDR